MKPEEVVELIKERMLRAEVNITHAFMGKIGEDGCLYLSDEGA